MNRSAMTQRSSARLIAVGRIAVALLLGGGISTATADETGKDSPAANAEPNMPHQNVHIVCFNPADRECLPAYQERIDRIMTDIQAWYRDEMKRNGFGPMTFPLERDKDGRLVIHVVKGSRSYARNEEMGTEEIRDHQIKPALRAKGIDIDREHIIIFQNLLGHGL